jgi:hypothetical protein
MAQFIRGQSGTQVILKANIKGGWIMNLDDELTQAQRELARSEEESEARMREIRRLRGIIRELQEGIEE